LANRKAAVIGKSGFIDPFDCKTKINLHLKDRNVILFGTSKRTPPSHPQARRQIAALGVRLRAARLRRKMTQPMLAERVGVSIPTIAKLEDGDPSTSLATMLRVLAALSLAADIDLLAVQDSLGRSLQDSELKRAMPKRATPTPKSETADEAPE
jgi:transcriptional regulator with XRE-family HTH domain